MSQIRAVKEATDIVTVIGSRVDLKRSGSYYKGLCPFHSEKTPSFFVSEEMQRYKCFGCGETGDVFNFLEEYEGMSFYEALKMLADQAGITLKEYTRTDQDELHDQLLEALDLAKEYYHYLLTKHKVGQQARDYLKDRGVTQESIKLFQLGYALRSWDGLISFMNKKKQVDMEVLKQAGLVGESQKGRVYDRFRGRIMFPLTNRRGQVVGFSGRLLEEAEKQAKYINTPETNLYNKSKLLYGYSQLYQHIREAGKVIVVEGEFDVITSSQAHVNNVVAIKGSALTEDHAKLLARTVDTVLLALDTDEAGVKATKKAIEALQNTKLELRVVEIPSGKDPDDLIRSSPKKWRQAVKQSVTAYNFLIDNALAEYDEDTPEGKRAVMEEVAPILATVSHAVELEHYVRSLSKKLNVKEESIHADIVRYRRQERLGGDGGSMMQSNRMSSGRSESGQEVEDQGRERVTDTPVTRRANLERYLFYLFLRSKPEQQTKRLEQLNQLELVLPGAKQLVEAMTEQLEQQAEQQKQQKQQDDEGQDSDEPPELDLEALRTNLPKDLQELLFDLHTPENFLELDDDLKITPEWRQTYNELATEITKVKISRIARELAELDEKLEKTPEEEQRQNKLLKKIVELRQKLKVEDD